ncbi:zinc/iron-chelating domain-containing protein [Verrucomicrobia bacterium LW23]|nr:zinc/iron-chelating domain-containing protein [Verrucomicrobia bacterium LW23]
MAKSRRGAAAGNGGGSARGPSAASAAEARRAALAEVLAVYAELEKRPAERSCTLRTECCQFRLTGRTPMVTAGEAEVAARGVRASGRRSVEARPDGACPLLHPRTGRCMAYAARPFGCRTHFCEAAGGPRDRSSVLDLIRRLERADEMLDGCGPRPFPAALQEALEQA